MVDPTNSQDSIQVPPAFCLSPGRWFSVIISRIFLRDANLAFVLIFHFY
jgi:hypothetical protein